MSSVIDMENFFPQATKKNKSEVTMTTGNIIIATGERPRYLDIPGSPEYTVTR